MKKLIVVAIMLLAIFSLSFATVANVLYPISKSINDEETVYLGKIGPGQTIDIIVAGKTKTGGRWGLGGTWQILRVIEVPSGWVGFDSKEMAEQMKVSVKASENAPDGKYKIKLKLEEDITKQQELGSVTFYAVVDVSRDVLGTIVVQRTIETGVEQPARYRLIVENKGSASDVFEITSSGVPTWEFKKSIHVPAGGVVDTFYEFIANEEKEYYPTITVKSISSDEIKVNESVKLIIKSNVAGDIKATKNGVLISPMILEPLYSLLGIIGYLI